eukprot:GILK01003221.1.p1 GENE.GILK01003221.1~~GILK01003221.1.p1  ORF type:complete len:583 (+),score=69.43 GILK01003221.1:36-1751(+)
MDAASLKKRKPKQGVVGDGPLNGDSSPLQEHAASEIDANHLRRLENQLHETMSILKENLNRKESGANINIDPTVYEHKLKHYKEHLSTHVQERLESVKHHMLNQIADCVKDVQQMTHEDKWGLQADESRSNRGFSEKVFVSRESLMSRMLHDSDIQTIYNIFFAMFLLLGCRMVAQEFFETGKLVDFSLWIWCFGEQHIVIPMWTCLFLSSFSIVFLVKAIVSLQLPWQIWVPVYVGMHAGVWCFGSAVCLHYKLPAASGFIIMCETTRFSMKIHAYLREKLLYGVKGNKWADFVPAWAPLGLAGLHKPHITNADLTSELKRFWFFLWVPTLVYRDQYPRLPHIRWGRALKSFLDCIMCILYTFLIFKNFCVPEFKMSPEDHGNVRRFVMSCFASMIPGTLVLLLGFFGILHSWFNGFAELTRYADRRFYEDWWNSKNFGQYYRKWNAVVHEWLYYYVFLDTIRFSWGRAGRYTAMLLTFLISALVHEVIISFGLGFFYPILLLMFGGPGVIFVRITTNQKRWGNLFMWAMLFIGTGLLMVLYSREWYARLHLPKTDSWLPRSWEAFISSA